MIQKWFINSHNFIKGPFTTDEIAAYLQKDNPELQTIFIWGRGQTDWTRADRWNPTQQSLQQTSPLRSTPTFTIQTHPVISPVVQAQKQTHSIQQVLDNKTPPSKSNLVSSQASNNDSDTEATQTLSNVNYLVENIKSSVIEKMRVQYKGVELPEMTKEELIQFTAKQEEVDKILIFDKKTQEWRDIYTVQEVANKLGISRRKSQRVPILAQFTGKNLNNSAVQARIVTISAGGIGLTENYDLKLGETISGQIVSPHFYTPITVSAEVTYSGLDGYVGLKFVEINDEGIALITDYVKRFGSAPDAE